MCPEVSSDNHDNGSGLTGRDADGSWLGKRCRASSAVGGDNRWWTARQPVGNAVYHTCLVSIARAIIPTVAFVQAKWDDSVAL